MARRKLLTGDDFAPTAPVSEPLRLCIAGVNLCHRVAAAVGDVQIDQRLEVANSVTTK